MSVIILPCGKAKSCHLKMWSSDVTIPSLILIVNGSGPDLLSMVAFTRTLSPSRNGCPDPFHVAPSVAMIGLPCSPLCLVKWDPAGLVGDSSAGALPVNHRIVIWGCWSICQQETTVTTKTTSLECAVPLEPSNFFILSFKHCLTSMDYMPFLVNRCPK